MQQKYLRNAITTCRRHMKDMVSKLYKMKKPNRLSRKLHHYGFGQDRFMWWWWQDIMNFGDWIGPELFAFRTKTLPIYAPVYDRPSHSAVNITVGSIMTGINTPNVAIVWGSGILTMKAGFAEPRDIRAVRGPLSRKRCLDQNYACPEIYGDPGLLLGDLYDGSGVSISADVGIVPHFQDINAVTARFKERDDVKIIDVRRPVGDVISDILGCRLIVSSSMHGIIAAHAFGRRALHVEFGRKVPGDGTKFHDYYIGMGFAEAPKPIHVDDNTSFEDIRHQAEASGIPDISNVREALWNSCPF